MKSLILIALIAVAASAQTITTPPVRMALYMSSDGGNTFAPLTSASGVAAIGYTPQRFTPYCTADNGVTWSQCTFGGGSGGSGTVNNGSAYAPAYYPSSGTAVAAPTPFNGLSVYSTSAAPRAAAASDVSNLLGSATGCTVSSNLYSPATNSCITPPSTSVTGGAGIAISGSSSAVTVAVSPAGTSGQVQTNNSGVLGAITSTSTNTPSTLVQRDSAGNVAVGALTSTGQVNTAVDPTAAIGNVHINTQYFTTALTPFAGNYQTVIGLLSTYNAKQVGYSLGNSSTNAQGWFQMQNLSLATTDASSGIAVGIGSQFAHDGKGDWPHVSLYGYGFGSETDTSAEGGLGIENHVTQDVAFTGTCSAGCTTGSSLVTVNVTTANERQSPAPPRSMNEGGMLLDITKGGTITGTITGYGFDSTLNSQYYTTSGATFPVSTATGTITGSTCTPNNNGQFGVTSSTTCTLTVASGTFSTSAQACLSGPWNEQVAVTALSGGNITFTTAYPWNSSNNSVIMQGGSCGQALKDSANNIAYMAVGATTTSRIYFSNCAVGVCNGPASSNTLPAGTSFAMYPAAYIAGTNGGTTNQANLALNTVPFASGDSLLIPQAAQEYLLGERIFVSADTPTYNCSGPEAGCATKEGILIQDVGKTALNADIDIENTHIASAPTQAAIVMGGAFKDNIELVAMPTQAVIRVLGNLAGTGGSYTNPWNIFQFDGGGPGQTASSFSFNPATGAYGVNGSFAASTFNGVPLTSTGSATQYLNAAGMYTTPSGSGGGVVNSGHASMTAGTVNVTFVRTFASTAYDCTTTDTTTTALSHDVPASRSTTGTTIVGNGTDTVSYTCIAN